MAGLHLHTGNRLEDLAGRLAERIGIPPSSPLLAEVVVVQSRVMERWLSMELARRQGICANIRFPYPNTFLDEIFRAFFPECGQTGEFDPEIMAWKIMSLLPSCLRSGTFKNIRNYLRDDFEHIKLFQISNRIASLFDHYLIFRPEMILDWEAGRSGRGDEAWQAELWRMLAEKGEGPHPPALRKMFLEKGGSTLPAAGHLPERISLFGISWLPPFHTEILYEISRRIDVHLFLVNPCREFWTDIRSEQEMGRAVARIREATGDRTLSGEALYLEKGNSLLASWGAQGRDFFRLFSDLPAEEWDGFVEPGEETLLQAVQSDILNLRERGRDGRAKTPLSPGDRSIQIHSCHSPMREVEVLYDQILALFGEDPGLLPKDILIMAPDIEVYAPLIQAVFDAPPETPSVQPSTPRIPVAIVDRSRRKDSLVADRFLDLIELCTGRFEASSVLSLLDTTPVKRKFSLSEEDMERIRRWTADARIKWGTDGEGRRREGLPAFAENTWAAGLERFLLGFALPGREERLFRGILPCDDIEGHDAQALGGLAEFLQGLFAEAEQLTLPRTLRAWSDHLTGLMERFFAADEETEEDLRAARRTLLDLGEIQDRSRFGEPLGIGVVLPFLRRNFEEQGGGPGFISGAVTCCAMLPMRSIPFQAICLLGMNHDAYPRRSGALGFDLMARHPRPGDPSRRNDDRYLFLEALISARWKLIISHVGQTLTENSPIPPSVLVSELVDYVEQGFTHPDRAMADHLTTIHRLQAFHPAYFTGRSKLFSHSEENLRAAMRLREARREAPPFLASPLPLPAGDSLEIRLDDLIRFFRNPSRFFLEHRLALRLGEDEEISEDQEMFDVTRLDRYDLEQRLLEKALAGQDPHTLYPLFRAAGRLPHGAVGACLYDQLVIEAGEFVEKIRPYLADPPSPPADIHREIAGFQIRGRIDCRYPGGTLLYRYATLKPSDFMRMWIIHLVLNILTEGEGAHRGTLVGRDRAWRFPPVENADAILAPWLHAYRQGLSSPLKFFPDASWRYAELIERGKPREAALRAAEGVWKSDYGRAESQDRSYLRCFGGTDALDGEFERTAIMLIGPILRHRTEAGTGPGGDHDSL